MLLRALSLVCALPLTQATETVLGVYIFSRHGDRTAKSTPPSSLTDLGYSEVFASGASFRSRYVASNATHQLAGISSDLVKLSQISVSAPFDGVLMPSAQGFLQGLYPPVGGSLNVQTLRDHSRVQAPLNGYQLIPIATVASGANSEDSAWLQGQSNCANALASSDAYFSTPEYKGLLSSTQSFYESLAPLVNGTFSGDRISYRNAYSIFDLLNVASINNASFDPSNALSPSDLSRARTLSDTHEWNLAYNASDPARAIAGATLAAQVVQSLNATIASAGKSKLTIQFGAYASFLSFFGLADLTRVGPDFSGIPDYTSAMVFELFTTDGSGAGESRFPSTDELSVRFLFRNGSAGNSSDLGAFPLFGQKETSLPWTDFVAGMEKFAIGSQTAWCAACGNSTGVCAAGQGSASTTSGGASAPSGGGMSLAVAGVIGALVTLVVVLGLEALLLHLSGVRLVTATMTPGFECRICNNVPEKLPGFGL